VLLDLTDGDTLADDAAPWRDRVDVVAGRTPTPTNTTALLLRPDGYVAWASDRARPDDRQRRALCDTLAHWFGLPTAPTVPARLGPPPEANTPQ
jgi:hypothetical protein